MNTVEMVSPCDYRDNGRGEWVHAPWCTCPAQRKALARVIPLRSMGSGVRECASCAIGDHEVCRLDDPDDDRLGQRCCCGSVPLIVAPGAVDFAFCECIFSCADNPPTACSLSGEWHVHPDWPCPVHPDAPGDR